PTPTPTRAVAAEAATVPATPMAAAVAGPPSSQRPRPPLGHPAAAAPPRAPPTAERPVGRPPTPALAPAPSAATRAARAQQGPQVLLVPRARSATRAAATRGTPATPGTRPPSATLAAWPTPALSPPLLRQPVRADRPAT